MSDPVNNPKHYTGHPSGIECIQVTEHMGFCLGNAVKYICRAEHKGNYAQDLNRAIWYLRRYVELLTKNEPRRPNEMPNEEHKEDPRKEIGPIAEEFDRMNFDGQNKEIPRGLPEVLQDRPRTYDVFKDTRSTRD